MVGGSTPQQNGGCTLWAQCKIMNQLKVKYDQSDSERYTTGTDIKNSHKSIACICLTLSGVSFAFWPLFSNWAKWGCHTNSNSFLQVEPFKSLKLTFFVSINILSYFEGSSSKKTKKKKKIPTILFVDTFKYLGNFATDSLKVQVV